jgi:hypothetical protein
VDRDFPRTRHAPDVPIAFSIAGKCESMTLFSSCLSPRFRKCLPAAQRLSRYVEGGARLSQVRFQPRVPGLQLPVLRAEPGLPSGRASYSARIRALYAAVNVRRFGLLLPT